jgi:ABC-type glutathione transport system ATPase component
METQSFDRVLVMEGGRIVEDGSPSELARRPRSHYGKMLESEAGLQRLWSDDIWRHWKLDQGKIVESGLRVAEK